MAETFTPTEIQDYHRQIASDERDCIQVLYDGAFEASASLSPQLVRTILCLADPYINAPHSLEARYSRSCHPTPGLGLIDNAFGLLYEDIPVQRQMVAAFLGEVVLPLIRLEQTDPVIVTPNLEGLSTCKAAEDYFLDAAAQAMEQRYRDHHTLRTYYDSDGPIAFRKTKDRPTALLLRSTHGVPAGTIINMDEKSAGHITHYVNDNWVEEACEVSDSLSFRPLRISPWAYSDIKDRALFAVGPNSNTYNSDLGTLFSETTLDTFVEAAQQTLTRCL